MPHSPTVFSALRVASRRKLITVSGNVPRNLSGVDGRSGWWPLFGGAGDRMTGDWQRDVEVRSDLALANWCVFACMTLIAGDCGKLRLKLVEQDEAGIWNETTSAAFSPVLRKPNRYQTRQMFIESWLLSKLSQGNAYILKERDNRGIPIALYPLDPHRVMPLVAPDGSVYYQLLDDNLAQVPTGLPAIPASEIIHDRMWCLFHPLCGLPPLYACALAATQGLKIQQHSARFFENMARPSGVLTAPAHIADDTAKRLKEHFESGYTGINRGKVAVLGDGLSFQPMTQNAVDADLVKQLELTATMICATFHVAPYMVGAGPVPTNNNVESLEVRYYSKSLQKQTEAIEALLDEGLGLTEPKEGRQLGTEFELDDLLKMDRATLMTTLKTGVDGSILAPNEARQRINMGPAKGGDSPMAQQQQYSLEALAQRDADKPFAKPPAGAPAVSADPNAAGPNGAPPPPNVPPAPPAAKGVSEERLAEVLAAFERHEAALAKHALGLEQVEQVVEFVGFAKSLFDAEEVAA